MMNQMQDPVDPDAIYQEFNKNLYRITGSEETDTIMNMLSADPNGGTSQNVETSVSDLGSGTSGTTTDSTGALQSGKTGFEDPTPGYFLGMENGLAVFAVGDSTDFIQWDGSTLRITGDVSIGSLNIPDTTTANSMHVDAAGNTWWGSNEAGGTATATAYILNTGSAVFHDIQIGGNTQIYTITDNGVLSFGDGSDGTATCDGSTSVAGMTLSGGNYTLTRDVYFEDLTINNGVKVTTAGYRIFGHDAITVNGNIDWSGNAGNAGANASGGTNGAGGTGGGGLADGYLKGALGGVTGGTSVSGSGGRAGANGVATSNSIGANGANGGSGGNGQFGAPGAGGTGGTASLANVKLIANWHLATLLDISSSGSTVKFNNSASAGAGGSGDISGGGSFGSAGGGGGSASGGGIIAIYAKTITIGATGLISSNGGVGGAGGNGANAGAGRIGSGGGGGGGGAGGPVILVYNILNNTGSITSTGGTGGAGGTSPGAGTGAGGGSGVNGTIFEFQLSL